MVDQDSPILPMVALLSKVPEVEEGRVQSRLCMDGTYRSAMARSGATCTTAATIVEGSLVSRVIRHGESQQNV